MIIRSFLIHLQSPTHEIVILRCRCRCVYIYISLPLSCSRKFRCRCINTGTQNFLERNYQLPHARIYADVCRHRQREREEGREREGEREREMLYYIYKWGPWLGSWTAAPKMGSFFVPVNSTVRGSGRRLLNWSKSHWFGHPRAGASPMFQKVLVP